MSYSRLSKKKCLTNSLKGESPLNKKSFVILKNDPAINPLDKLPEILKKNLDKNLCVCNEVVKMDIIDAIVKGATTVEDVKKKTYATMGSGCCTQQIERLIECLCSPKKRKRNRR